MGGLLIVTLSGLLLGIIPIRLLRRKLVSRPRVRFVPSRPGAPSARGYEEPARETGELSSLEEKIKLEEERNFIFKLNEKLCLAPDVHSIARYIVEDVIQFLSVESCVLFLYDPSKHVVFSEAAAGGRGEIKAMVFGKGESVTGEVAKSRQPLLINDLAANSFYNGLNKEEYLRNSFVSVPLIFKDELIGVINAANKRSGTSFRESDLVFLLNVSRVGAIAVKNCRLVEQLKKEYLDTITTLALLIDARDQYTNRHSENVTRYAVAMAEELKLDAEQIELIKRASLLHDIGKIAIRDSVLLKPGKLTDEEFEQIKAHAQKGADIVAHLPALHQISFLVRHHHEKFDGRGYPDGKKGTEIELGARIMAVADSFDAMTTDRPYRKGMALQDASAELVRCKGSQFDPAIVDCFISVLQRDPGLLETQVSSPARPARAIP